MVPWLRASGARDDEPLPRGPLRSRVTGAACSLEPSWARPLQGAGLEGRLGGSRCLRPGRGRAKRTSRSLAQERKSWGSGSSDLPRKANLLSTLCGNRLMLSSAQSLKHSCCAFTAEGTEEVEFWEGPRSPGRWDNRGWGGERDWGARAGVGWGHNGNAADLLPANVSLTSYCPVELYSLLQGLRLVSVPSQASKLG